MRNVIFALILLIVPAEAHTWDTSVCPGERSAGRVLPPQCVADLASLQRARLTPMEFEPDDDGAAYRRGIRLSMRGAFDAQHVTIRGRRYLLIVGVGDQEKTLQARDDRGRVVARARGLGLASDGKRIVLILRRGFREFVR